MPRAISYRLIGILFAGLPTVAGAQAPARVPIDSGTFVIRRGTDTIAVEHFTRTAVHLEGTLAMRGKDEIKQHWSAVIAPDATLPLFEITVREGADTGRIKARITQRARVIFKEDSAAVDAVTTNGLQTRIFVTRTGAVPYLNLSFALLEQAVRKVFRQPGKQGEVAFFNLGGGQTASAATSRLGADSLEVTLGKTEFHLQVDEMGRILGATIPAQNLSVERVAKS